MTFSYGFKSLSIHIVRFHSQNRTGGGGGGGLKLFARQTYTYKGTLIKNGRGAYAPININPDYPPHAEGWGLAIHSR